MRIFLYLKASFLVVSICVAGSVAMADGRDGFLVSGYAGTDSDVTLVIVEGGRSEGVASGQVFRVFRPARKGAGAQISVPVETGLIKAVAVHEHQTVAAITYQGSDISRSILKSYADIMAGDIAVAQRISIHANQFLAVESEIRYEEMFEDAKSSPTTYELTDEGKSVLSQRVAELGRARAGMLMVSGHTDSKGKAEANQIESYQRALAVRQYLVDQLGFDKDRVVAIGIGEGDLPEGDRVPGYGERARRIVLKVVPLPGAK